MRYGWRTLNFVFIEAHDVIGDETCGSSAPISLITTLRYLHIVAAELFKVALWLFPILHHGSVPIFVVVLEGETPLSVDVDVLQRLLVVLQILIAVLARETFAFVCISGSVG